MRECAEAPRGPAAGHRSSIPAAATATLPPQALELHTTLHQHSVKLLTGLPVRAGHRSAHPLERWARAVVPPPPVVLLAAPDSTTPHPRTCARPQALDDALRIGLPPAAITELVGPAGVGKSQFCYSLALQAAMPVALGGLAATLIYIDTEGKFSTEVR